MAKVGKRDLAAATSLVESGVWRETDPWKINFKNGVILVVCGDGDHYWGIQMRIFAWGLISFQRLVPRIHTLSHNGGAPRIYRGSRLGHIPSVLKDILAAVQMKDIRTVILKAHAPCGQAGACGVDLIELLTELVKAEEEIKALDPTLDTVTLVHMAWPRTKKVINFFGREIEIWIPAHKRVYCMSANAFRNWKQVYLKQEDQAAA